MSSDAHRLEGEVANTLVDLVVDRLSGRGFADLQWSPRMPDDDPNADLLVVDKAGQEYVLDIDVTLSATKGSPAPAA